MIDLHSWEPYALSGLRIFAALMLLQHGFSKLFRWPVHLPGAGPRPSPRAFRNGMIQVVCGSLLVVGLASRPAAFILSGMTAVGYFVRCAPRSFYPMKNKGAEMAFYAIVFLYVVFAGPGAISLDRVIFPGTWLYP